MCCDCALVADHLDPRVAQGPPFRLAQTPPLHLGSAALAAPMHRRRPTSLSFFFQNSQRSCPATTSHVKESKTTGESTTDRKRSDGRCRLPHGRPLIRDMANARKDAGLSDRELLEGFRNDRDEDAFRALVRRHGAMVLRVCRNVLGDEQDAEDAFQSTFLVLARRCGSIRYQESLAGWLHGVAHRTALHARRTVGRRRIRERHATPTKLPDPAGELSWREVQAILDEEIQGLPLSLRSVFVLCSRTREQLSPAN